MLLPDLRRVDASWQVVVYGVAFVTQPADSAALGLVELAGHADTIMVGNGPDPVGGHPRHSRKLSLPFGNVARAGQSGVKRSFRCGHPLHMPISGCDRRGLPSRPGGGPAGG